MKTRNFSLSKVHLKSNLKYQFRPILRLLKQQVIRITAILIVGILLVSSNASKAQQPVTVTITSDNAYVFGFGNQLGITDYHFPGVCNTTAGQIYSSVNGTETYTITSPILGGYIYIAAWSDNSALQGLIAEFSDGINTVRTSPIPSTLNPNVKWEVYATGHDLPIISTGSTIPYGNANCPPLGIIGSTATANLSTINGQIALANFANGNSSTSSIGWVQASATNIAGRVGVLAFGPNNSTGPVFPPGIVSGISTSANWMWYYPTASIPDPTSPFISTTSSVGKEYYIFRIGPISNLPGFGNTDTCSQYLNSVANLKVGTCDSCNDEKVTIEGGAYLDHGDDNTGTLAKTLKFGDCGTGEAIGSKRNAGGNQYGLDFYTSHQNRMVVSHDGNVGIGTTSPTQKLHVHEGSILLTGQNPSGGPMILFGDKTPPPFAHPHGNWGIEYEDGAGGLNFWRPFMSAGGFENFLLFLKDNGNIGINNSNPGNRLVITKGVPDQSGLRLTNLTSASPAVAPATSNVLSVDANGDVILVPCCSNSNTNYWSRNTTTGTIYPTNTASLGDKLALGTSSVLTTNPYLYPGGFNARLKLNGGDLVIQEDSINNVGSPDQGADVYLIDKNGNGLDIGAQNGNAELIAYGANTSLKFSTPGAPQGIIMHGDGTNKGKVQIGNVTTPGNYLLYVEKGIMAEKVKVALKSSASWADHVFADKYRLKSLDEVEDYIKENNHLPGIQSANELVNEGLDLGEMQAKQMEKIEELTLYMIQMKKEIDELKAENTSLKSNHIK